MSADVASNSGISGILDRHRPKMVTFDSPGEGCTCGENFPMWQHAMHLRRILDNHFSELCAAAEARGEQRVRDAVEAAIVAESEWLGRGWTSRDSGEVYNKEGVDDLMLALRAALAAGDHTEGRGRA